SAIAARLAQDEPMAQALAGAQAFCHDALAGAYPIAGGQLMPRRC
ncbi:MAG: hydroxymethylpyrimidine/phosphomethylpyrimidine kinase, partial [Burkholderiaceae bacterium]|nr:hydroxymethylpyrimidine/phosphomethylpyrimidine kinase [Burkholderiaceae bacterium]